MRSLIAALCTFFSVQAYAVTVDSIGVENNNGHQVIIHKVAPKETYYSIGRLYNVPPKEIISLNNNISLGIGTILKVPTQRTFGATITAKASKSTETKPSREQEKNAATDAAAQFIEYKVGPKETLFAIARKFGTTIGDIKQLNNLSGYSLSIGQILKIRQGNTAEVQNTTTSASDNQSPEKPSSPEKNNSTEEATAEVSETAAKSEKKTKTGRLGVTERNERGVAVWFEDEALDSTKMLALHRTAPVGTIIKITNPMTDRTTFVKVVGKFTDNETTKDAIIVLTKATADLLGALDKRFLVSIDYGMPNE